MKGYSKSKVCEKCAKEFGCGAEDEGPCWCREYTLSPMKLEELRKKYGDCLCPDCLKKMED